MENSGSFRRFSLNPTTFTSRILPQDNDDLIFNTKPPLSPGLDLSDSACSSKSVRLSCESESNGHEIDTAAQDFFSGSNYNSEPEDMQDYISVQNKSSATVSDNVNTSIDKDKSLNNMANSDEFGPFVGLYTSSPLALRGKKVSLSLQDMSSIETFPLLPKTNNGFSSETIPSQSLSSTSKSKDSGFQRSASCLSLNSGNRTYDHVQSKVRQYIRDIKNSEESRKRQKQSIVSVPKDYVISQKKSDTSSITSIAETVDNDSELFRSVSVLKNELKEKDSTLKQLQENYNTLLQKYAEAVNQIDLMRLRNSLNNSYRSDFTVSNEDLSDNNLNYSKNLYSHSTNRNINETEDFTSSLPNRLSSLSAHTVYEQRPEMAKKPRSESLDYQIFNNKEDSRPLQTKVERPQSSSSSTIVSNTQRTRTTTLGPISKYYSSSSRLGKKQNAPLPSSKAVNSEQLPQNNRIGGQRNAVISKVDDSPLRSYRMRNISKVNPFERVHTYLENFKKMREDSLPTKIDSNRNSSSDESTNQAFDPCFIATNNSNRNCTSPNRLPKQNEIRQTNRSKSEQNLFSNRKMFAELPKQNGRSREKIFNELPEQNGRSREKISNIHPKENGKSREKMFNELPKENVRSREVLQSCGRKSGGLLDSKGKRNVKIDAFQLRGSEKPGKKCSRNLLTRSEAFDSHSSLDENFTDDVDDFGNNHLSDDSSSISSSIFSLPKDDGYPSKKHNSRTTAETDWKTVSHTKSVKSTVWEKRKSCQTLSQVLPKRKKPDRVCYSPKNRRVPEKRSTPSQEDAQLNPRTTPSSNKKTEFHEKLKIYTEILKSKPNRDVGVQVSETEDDTKQLEDSEDLSRTNRLDCLSEASEYLKQMKQGMDRLCDYIENLKVDSGNRKNGSLEGRL